MMTSRSDARYFTSQKKGEVAEWRDEIHDPDRDKRKNAVKKVIAAMTVGKDVSMLFTDVVNCGQTDSVELKKLVYLYLINYAKTQPDLAILAVNTFVKDSQDPNPLIRALAVRTMGCIRVSKIIEYLCDPLHKALLDEDPYVRKTAAICVAKLYDAGPEMVTEHGFVDHLRELLDDSNPMVVANSVAALAEIREKSCSPDSTVGLDSKVVHKLLAALNECTEWGQVFILDTLSSYVSQGDQGAERVIERVLPRLQHANCAVVLSAVKVIVVQLEDLRDPARVQQLVRKLAPSLVTLLSAEAEIQYVALRNINLIIQKYPDILKSEVKVFFCKYNDPIFVKQEKIETMVRLATERNIDQVLLEFKEYSKEVDVEFVKKAVQAIGRCAISIEQAAERCISVLLELIETKVNYVVQESIVVIKHIFRRYPNQYEGIIECLCDSLDTLDEPEAKSSMIWIIGEYAERIDNAEELLEAFLDTFLEETPEVQLQLLTSTVKLFLKKPATGPQILIQNVLHQATIETDNPDLRDRAFVYWRLLSSDPESAKDVVLAMKPTIRDDLTNSPQTELLQGFLRQLSTLSSIYHKLPPLFVPHDPLRTRLLYGQSGETKNTGLDGSLTNLHENQEIVSGKKANPDPLVDLMDGTNLKEEKLGNSKNADTIQLADPVTNEFRLFYPSESTLLSADKGAGLEISGVIMRGEDNLPCYSLKLTNHTSVHIDHFQFQFNKNSFMLAPCSQLQYSKVAPNESFRCLLRLSFSGSSSEKTASPWLQVAVKSSHQCGEVFYFNDRVPLESVLLPEGRLEYEKFVQLWNCATDEYVAQCQMSELLTPEAVIRAFDSLNVFACSPASFSESDNSSVYLSAKAPGPHEEQWILVKITFTSTVGYLEISSRSFIKGYADMIYNSLRRLLLGL